MKTPRFSRPSFGFMLGGLLLLGHVAIAQHPDRSTRPSPGPAPSFTIPPVQHFLLSNGLPVVLLEKHQVPIVQIDLLVRAGSASDVKGKNGLANMTAAMMMEGAGSRSALALADAIDYLGASITSSSGHHAAAVRLHSPLSRLDSALALFADVALRPTFPAEELARQKKERLTALLQWRDEARMLSVIAFNRALYGDNHPYGRLSTGSEETLNALSREDCEEFHALWFHPNNATLIVVGDVDARVMKPKLEAALGSWKQGAVSRPALPAIEQLSGRQVIVVDKPGAPQTEIRIGRIGVERNTPDYFSISVMNTILGGSFTSRLNNNLREEHGYTYGAGSGFDFRLLPGPFRASSAVQTVVTDKALAEFMKELRGILEGVSDLELERGKNYLALSFPGEFQTVGQIASQLEELVTYNLPDAYFNSYVSSLLAVTQEDVQRVARRYIDPDRVVLVLVGDRKVIEDPVRALNLGPIIFKTVEDVLGKPPVIDASQ